MPVYGHSDITAGINVKGKEERMKCVFHWNVSPCTPNECNFVYCEHNANRVFTVKEEARRKVQSSTPKVNDNES